jgi:hypothetical protein
MSTRQPLKDDRNRIIGYLEILSDGRHRMANERNQVLGHFDPRTNRTVDANNRTVGTGDLLAMLQVKGK